MEVRTLIIIPAYNEEKNIIRVVEYLKEVCPAYDYVVINDGSTDRTAALCECRHFHLISLPTNLGLAGAFQTGMRYAREKGYECVIQFDADGQHRPEYVSVLEQKIKDGWDIAIASRFEEKKKPKTMRMMGSNLIQAILKITTKQTIKDPTSGMRAFSQSMIEKMYRGNNVGPEPDTIAWLIRGGAKVVEIQAEMDERIAGTSYLTFGRSISYMLHMSLSICLIQWVRSMD